MKSIDKYIFKEFIVPFSYCFFAFVILFVIGDLFENLDNFIKQKLPWYLVNKYYLFLIPTVFVWTAPLAILLSLLYQLGYMSRYNELTALKASGVSLWRIIVPFGVIAIIFSFLVFGINERLVPPCTAEMDYIRTHYIHKKMDPEIQKEVKNVTFFSSAYNMSLYMDKVSKNRKSVEGLSVRAFNDDGSIKKEWYAKNALWLDNSWWLFDGYTRKFSLKGEKSGITHFFKKKELRINIPPQDLVKGQIETEKIGNYMNFIQLHNYIKRNYTKATLPNALLVDLYKKLSIPITVLIITLFGVAFGSRISRGGALSSVGASIGFYLIYYGLSSFLLALGKLGKLIPALAVWTPQLIFSIIGIILIKNSR